MFFDFSEYMNESNVKRILGNKREALLGEAPDDPEFRNWMMGKLAELQFSVELMSLQAGIMERLRGQGTD